MLRNQKEEGEKNSDVTKVNCCERRKCMYCIHCGEIINDGVEFCPICGAEQTLNNDADREERSVIIGKAVKAGKTLRKVGATILTDVIFNQILEEVTDRGQKIVEKTTGKVGKSLQKKGNKVIHKALVGMKIEKPSISLMEFYV